MGYLFRKMIDHGIAYLFYTADNNHNVSKLLHVLLKPMTEYIKYDIMHNYQIVFIERIKTCINRYNLCK